MSTLELTKTKMRQGIWEGVLSQSGTGTPEVSVTHLGKPVVDVSLEHDSAGDLWVLRIPIPPAAISDGVQTVLINDKATMELLGQVTLIAGEALGEDMRAEVDLLRAELDLLKRAFRRHCVETT